MIEELVDTGQTPSAQDRKRRKRIGGPSGPSNDCFTCSTRNVVCDRRRPFCSKCLEDGKECSGYKTQLKWGVGVASRGKLRGLALPIASTQQLPGQLPRLSRPKKRQVLATRATSQDFGEISSRAPSARPSLGDNQQPSSILKDSLISPSSNDLQPTEPAPLPTSDNQPEVLYSYLHNPSLQNSPTFSDSPGNISPLTQGSPTTYSQTQFVSHHPRIPPAGLSTSQTDLLSLYLQSQWHHGSATQSIPIPQPTSHPQAGSFFPFQGSPTIREARYDTPPQLDEPSLPRDSFWLQQPQFYSQQMNSPVYSESISLEADDRDSVGGMSLGTVDSECATSTDTMTALAVPRVDFALLSMAPAISNGFGIGKTPRMQFLLKYFAQVISPVIVAFDRPSNPFRTFVLNLATENEPLQHAISALSASNLRQRLTSGTLSTGKTSPARMSSMAYLTLTGEERSRTGASFSQQDRIMEEEFHKRHAIKALNLQLADPVAQKSDSVLAILLLLLLVHICGSGIANFQIEFAGVKKLLALRENDGRRETQWFTQMFTVFDAITASVNDREGQIYNYGQDPIEVQATCDDEWSLCKLAGCDEELFKALYKLGRLNVLSQGKQVGSNPPVVCRPVSVSHPTVSSNDKPDAFNSDDWARLTADGELFHDRTQSLSIHEQFWREWYEVRRSLHTWERDPATILACQNPSPGPSSELTREQRVDLLNISESFRYASLLYTERLARPSAASTDGKIVEWVRHGLHFIKQVKSDVYLLWPLFIIGAECVDEADIDVIRTRCLDIQKDSGFLNNQSALEVLEKIWAANKHSTDNKTQDHQANHDSGCHDHHDCPYGTKSRFRFTKIMEMEENKGEYILI